jgi:ATP diphosphatase
MAALVQLMATLRSPDGCPWDRAQTPRSLRPFLLEETYEALEAIDRGEAAALRGELGDVVFQCVFQAQLAAEQGSFEMADAIDAIVAKLVRRHPHVFRPDGRPIGPASARRGVRTPRAVLEQWEQLKAREQQAAGATPRLLTGVPRVMPALLRAHEIGTRVAAVGFDWPAASDVMAKIREETAELDAALDESPARAAEELGDLLFAIANLARKLGIEPESALRAANDKFTERFTGVEALLESRGRSVHVASLEDMERAWEAVKAAHRAHPAPPTRSTTAGRARSRSARSPRRSRG